VDIPAEFSRLDEINVRVAYGEQPGTAPQEVFDLVLSAPDLGGRPWDDDDFVAELEPLVWASKKRSLYDRKSYTLDVKKGHGSWGADGAAAEIVLYIANHAAGGLIDAGTVALVLKVLRTLRAKVGETNTASTQTPDEIAEFATWRIQVAFRDWLEPGTALTLVEEIRDVGGMWTGAFADAEGNRYAIEVHFLEGVPYATRVTRRATPRPRSGRPQ